MSDRAAFVSAIAAAPDDDLPKLVFADWLDENGQPARAEFIRLQIAARKEANLYPPVIDQNKLDRIRELFMANYRDWLRPVYDALAEPLPVFEQPQPNMLGRFVRGLRNLGRQTSGQVETPTAHLPSVFPTTLRYIHSGPPVALNIVAFQNGFVDALSLSLGDLQPAADFPTLFAAEPINFLALWLSAQPEVWWRFDGPHLRRVRELCIRPHSGSETQVSEWAAEVCGSEHLGGLRRMRVLSDYTPDGVFSAALFDALRHSPLRRQLENLALDGIRNVTRFLTDPDPGFDALDQLFITFVAPPGEADLFGGGVSAALRGRLKFLSVSTPVADVRWLTTGPAWEKLQGLSFRQAGLGPSSLGAIGHSTLLPALWKFTLIDPNLTAADLMTLARVPLVERLRMLTIEGPPLDDNAVRSLAATLLCGLRYLELRGVAHRRLWKELTAQYSNRIELHPADPSA